VVLAGAMLSGCATNGASQIPSTTTANLNSNVLQLAVGTARIGQDNTVGLNVVATLRQANGLTGVLADQPTLTGPFTVPAGMFGAYSSSKYGANVDAGKGQISGSPQEPRNNQNLVNSTLGTFTGVTASGFGPFNSDQTTTSIGAYYPGIPNNSTGNGFTYSNYDYGSILAADGTTAFAINGDPTQPLPFFSADPFDYLVGPPAVPFFNDGTFPSAFAGYLPGFEVFEVAPVAGSYNLSAVAQAANVAPVTYKASATLASATPLGPTTVTFTPSNGGGSGQVVVPAGVTETEVFITDATAGTFYTVGPLTGTGTVNFTLPGNLGPCAGTGCQNGSGAKPSIASGDTWYAAAVGYDYPAFESEPPGNKSQKPTIVGSNGQADITMSPIINGTAP
jgi:hypothetical protein